MTRKLNLLFRHFSRNVVEPVDVALIQLELVQSGSLVIQEDDDVEISLKIIHIHTG